ncbi:MAG: alkene reductase [Alphaproteobacteria bacterium CG_4_10_14_0_2_um_filter_63_37]|nr:MAG: alkene reductase [Proteobacteria bacterium CG1_02_64_396]PJA24665.1 MAG: alkene reductase [Alphaproteobacteria bacterium CG_4_10_14_0_2_um_filter_63_37]
MSNTLFTPIQLGAIELKNRVVMAPMTRCRALGNTPNAMIAEHYRRRADAGLIVTEGASPSPNGLGYARVPGIYSPEQVEGWRQVAEAVHGAGGRMFVQLMHSGRVGHATNLPEGAKLVAPSALPAPGEMWTDGAGMQPNATPEAMSEAQILATVEEYAHAARCAVEAGLDGVELHGANGYLIDQFLNTASNRRDDRWGGSIENRIRFAVAVAKGCVAAIGADKVGMRISPFGVFNGMTPDPEMVAMYEALVAELSALGLVYIHVVDHSSMGAPPLDPAVTAMIRDRFKGRYILSGGYDAVRANADLDAGKGDLVAFGRPFIANADLVVKLQSGAELAQADPSTFYAPGKEGYLD